MKFKYSEYQDEKIGKLFRPTLPIVFKYNQKFICTEALIDSGADFTILPIEIAGVLNIKLDGSTKMDFHGAGNNSFTVYPSQVRIEHLIRQDGFRPLVWKTAVYFAESQPAILLGNRGFLENFKVTLDGKKKETEIHS